MLTRTVGIKIVALDTPETFFLNAFDALLRANLVVADYEVPDGRNAAGLSYAGSQEKNKYYGRKVFNGKLLYEKKSTKVFKEITKYLVQKKPTKHSKYNSDPYTTFQI